MTQIRPAAAPESELDARQLRRLTLVLAVACGLAVANIYYAQPLLGTLARSFGVGEGSAALVVTLTQVGYAAGLLFLVPLGDLLENKALATRVLIGTAVALAAAAAAPSLGVFLAASLVVGLTSVVVQVLVPLAAHFAPEGRHGAVVGRVMSGLLLGILLARTVSSLVAAAFGWRTVYAASAVLMVVLAITLSRMLPQRRPAHDVRYTALLRSTVRLLRTEPVLRRRAAYQSAMFAVFSAFWTSIAYELHDRHHLGQTGIGLFALVGAGGAAAAPVAGWLGDRGHNRAATGATLVLGAAMMALFPRMSVVSVVGTLSSSTQTYSGSLGMSPKRGFLMRSHRLSADFSVVGSPRDVDPMMLFIVLHAVRTGTSAIRTMARCRITIIDRLP